MENTQEVIDLIKSNITPLVEASKEIGSIGWEILFKKVFLIDGVASLLLGVFLSFLTYFLYKNIKKSTKDEGWEDDPLTLCLVIIFATGAILSFIFAIGLTFGSIPRLILPEYYVILEILKTF